MNNNLDVHGLTLIAAQKVIKNAIIQAYNNDISVLYINHGFNKGNKIKSWCKKEIKNLNYVIKVDAGDNEGITKVFIETNFLK